jgi:glyoxylase I family protein
VTDTSDITADTSNAAAARPSGIHHVRLTVTDIGRSRDFYARVFGSAPAVDFSGQSDAGIREDPHRLYGGCVFIFGQQIVGLRPVAPAGDRFESTRVGLDHIGLSVDSVADLRAAAERLAAQGITHGEVTELTAFGLAILSLQDPDDINLELVAPISQ